MRKSLNEAESFHTGNANDIDVTESSIHQPAQKQTIRECVGSSLSEYFNKVDHENISELYDLVLSEVEAPLLETVMRQTRSNQSKASKMLGINRGTLRKKLKKYGMLN